MPIRFHLPSIPAPASSRWRMHPATTFIFAIGMLAFVPRMHAQTWTPLGLAGERITSIAVDASEAINVGTNGHGLFRTTDQGAAWKAVYTAHDSISAVVVNQRGVMFVASTQARDLARSRDGGATWDATGDFPSGVHSLALGSSGNVFVGSSIIDYSTDPDGSWWTSFHYFKFPAVVHAMALNWADELWAIPTIARDTVVRSTSHSNYWDICPLPKSRALAITPSMRIFVGTDNGIFRSDNRGDLWNDVSGGLANREVRCITLSPDGGIFIGTAAGVYRSSGYGTQWTPMSDGLTGQAITAIAASPSGTLYAATATAGLFRITPPVTGIDASAPAIADFSLRQNYPNPFNPSTTIVFTLPARAEVTLTVHDILGRTVADLAHGELAAGEHSRTWSADALPAGMYVARVHAGNRTLTRALLLVK